MPRRRRARGCWIWGKETRKRKVCAGLHVDLLFARAGTYSNYCLFSARHRDSRSTRMNVMNRETMILRIYTIIHVLISLLGIFTGLIVLFGMLAGKRLDGWTRWFLI